MNASDKTYLATAGLTKEAGIGGFALKTLKEIPGLFKGRGVREFLGAAGRQMKEAPGAMLNYFKGGRGLNKLDSFGQRSSDIARQIGKSTSDEATSALKKQLDALYKSKATFTGSKVPTTGVSARGHFGSLRDAGKQGMKDNRFGVMAYGGLGAGAGVGAGNKALNIAGQMTAPGSDAYQQASQDAWGQAASASRLGMLFNPQGELQRISESLAATAPEKSWTRWIPGMGFSAGRQDAQRKLYQQLSQSMQGASLPLSVRLAYAMNPESTSLRMRDYFREMGYPV